MSRNSSRRLLSRQLRSEKPKLNQGLALYKRRRIWFVSRYSQIAPKLRASLTVAESKVRPIPLPWNSGATAIFATSNS